MRAADAHQPRRRPAAGTRAAFDTPHDFPWGHGAGGDVLTGLGMVALHHALTFGAVLRALDVSPSEAQQLFLSSPRGGRFLGGRADGVGTHGVHQAAAHDASASLRGPRGARGVRSAREALAQTAPPLDLLGSMHDRPFIRRLFFLDVSRFPRPAPTPPRMTHSSTAFTARRGAPRATSTSATPRIPGDRAARAFTVGNGGPRAAGRRRWCWRW